MGIDSVRVGTRRAGSVAVHFGARSPGRWPKGGRQGDRVMLYRVRLPRQWMPVPMVLAVVLALMLMFLVARVAGA